MICNRMANSNFNPYIAFVAFKKTVCRSHEFNRNRNRGIEHKKPQRFSMFLSKHQRPRSPSPSHSHRVRWPFNRVRVWRWLVRPSTIAIIARHCPRDRPTMILLMQPDITFCSLLSAICILRASAKKNSTSNFRSEEFASALFGKLSQWHNDNLHNNTKQLQKCHTVVVAFKLVQYSDEGTGWTSATKSVYLFKEKIRYFYQTRVQIFALPLKLKCSVYVKCFSNSKEMFQLGVHQR